MYKNATGSSLSDRISVQARQGQGGGRVLKRRLIKEIERDIWPQAGRRPNTHCNASNVMEVSGNSHGPLEYFDSLNQFLFLIKMVHKYLYFYIFCFI